MKTKRQITIRLDEGIAQAYEKMAIAKGISLTTLMQEILTSNLYSVSFKHEVNRVENLVEGFSYNLKKILKDFSEKNSLQNQVIDDIAFIQFMALRLLMANDVPKDDVKDLKSKAFQYSQLNYHKKDD